MRTGGAIGHGEHDNYVGVVSVGDEGLGAVQNPSALGARRNHARAARIGSGGGLGQVPTLR